MSNKSSTLNSVIPVPPGAPPLTVVIRMREIEDTEKSEYTGGIIVPVQTKRFINWAVRSNKNFHFTDDHYNGYTPAFPSLPWRSFSGQWGEDPHESNTLIYRVNLKSTAHAFVVDEQPYLETCDRISDQLKKKGSDRRTEGQISTIFAAIAKTLIPLAEYKQDYVRPFYLIDRPLKSDEAHYYEPPFKTHLFNREAARKVECDKRSLAFMKEFWQDAEPEPPAPQTRHSHLRLV